MTFDGIIIRGEIKLSLTITLTPEETARLNAFATAQYLPAEDIAWEAILNDLPSVTGLSAPMRDFDELFSHWIEEDKYIDPAEAAEILELKKG